MIKNRIPVSFGGMMEITGPRVSYQHDVVQYLVIKGLPLPDFYTVDFCNEGDTVTKPVEGNSDGVRIPDEYLKTGRKVKAYIMITGNDEGAVETRAEITLPVKARPARSDIEPTPEERLEIDTLVENLNIGVNRAETAAENAEGSATNAEKSAEDSEAWAVGERNGVAVDNTDETYQNNAKFYAGVAQQGAEASGYAWFNVNDEDGEMYVTITPNLAEDVSFLVNESIGTLEVTVHG